MRVRRWTAEPTYLCRVDFELSLYEIVCCCVIAAESGWFKDVDPEMSIVPVSAKDVDRRVRLVLREIGAQPLGRMAIGYGISRVEWQSVQAVVRRLFSDE